MKGGVALVGSGGCGCCEGGEKEEELIRKGDPGVVEDQGGGVADSGEEAWGAGEKTLALDELSLGDGWFKGFPSEMGGMGRGGSKDGENGKGFLRLLLLGKQLMANGEQQGQRTANGETNDIFFGEQQCLGSTPCPGGVLHRIWWVRFSEGDWGKGKRKPGRCLPFWVAYHVYRWKWA